MLGSVFVLINSNLGLIRKKYVNTTAKKLIETCLFSLATTTCFYYIPLIFDDCNLASTITFDDFEKSLVQYNCPEGYYDPLATMSMNTEG